MENEEQKEVVDEVAKEEVVEEQTAEKTEEELETERERNLKAENRRKQEELMKLREENERLREHRPPTEDEPVRNQLERMKDQELESYLNNAQYSNLHITIRDIQDERKFSRMLAKREEKQLKLDAEIEVENKFPEVLNPSHPMSIRTKELMRVHRLENHPQGRLIAARLAASEVSVKKATAAGRKVEQNRQADVKANFQGEASRPAPKVSDNVKAEELKKRAMAGDQDAQIEWLRIRAGQLQNKKD